MGIMQLLMVGGGVGAATGADLGNLGGTPAIRSAVMAFDSGGAISYTSGEGPSSWYSPLTPAIGDNYYLRIHVTSSANSVYPGIPTESWVSMSNYRSFQVSNSATSKRGSGSFVFQIATDSGGSNIVFESPICFWDVGYVPA